MVKTAKREIETLGQRIQRLRIAKGWKKQKHLVEATKLPRRTIQNLEYDKVQSPWNDTIEIVAKALGVTPDYLRYGEASAGPKSSPERADLIISITSRLSSLDEDELGTVDGIIKDLLEDRSPL